MTAEQTGLELAKILAKKAGPKVLKTGGKVAGRVAVFLGIAVSLYELGVEYKRNIEDEPVFQEMQTYQKELEKWGTAVSCLGRDSKTKGYGSFDEGGCINALAPKKTINTGQTIDPDYKQGKELLERAIYCVQETENLLDDGQFEQDKESLLQKLNNLETRIQPNQNYEQIRFELGKVVKEIQPRESQYRTKIYNCQKELDKTFPNNAAWATASAATLGIVTKRRFRKKKED
ncbi:MAG: hypothetical protein L6408_09440 [Nanoarchaeota archaeon]|nr:hypothetical protein [Nanoarchaeota archaeon]